MSLDARFAAACEAAGVGGLRALLQRLAFRPDDRRDTLAWAQRATSDRALESEVLRLVERIEARGARLVGESAFDDACCARTPERGIGVAPLLAFVATVPEAIGRRTARGLSVAEALDGMADLGQQVWVHRRVHGDFGLTNECWLNVNWAGGLVWLGRLQYSVEEKRPPWGDGSLGYFCHIPETGPLAADEVSASLELAAGRLPRWYPEVAGSDIHCVSWLLDPSLRELVAPTSNMARFADRFTDLVDVGDGDRDAVYFTFRREPPCDLAELPRTTSLERGIVERLAGGGHFRLFAGRIRP